MAATSTGPGKSRLFMNRADLAAAYPITEGWAFYGSSGLEPTNFDVGGDALKPEHRGAIWTFCLKNFDGMFDAGRVWGFRSHTGNASFNSALADRRSINAFNYTRLSLAPDTIIPKWYHTKRLWQRGDPDGESPEMRKVLIIFQVSQDLVSSAASSRFGQTRALT